MHGPTNIRVYTRYQAHVQEAVTLLLSNRPSSVSVAVLWADAI